jgi:hypothetical protein
MIALRNWTGSLNNRRASFKKWSVTGRMWEQRYIAKLRKLKRAISEMHRNRVKLEDTFPCHINEQEDEPRQTDKDVHVEETMHGQVKDLKEQEEARQQMGMNKLK